MYLGSRGSVLSSVYVAKTKVLISCADTTQLICAFASAYGKSRFSHDVAQVEKAKYFEITCFRKHRFGLFVLK